MNRHHRKSSFRPRLEALEDRWCPSCDIQLLGGTLTILGDAVNNAVAIVDNGPAGLNVQCDGTTSNFTQPINQVVVRTGLGADTVSYRVTNPNWGRREVLIDTGQGNDSVTFEAANGLTTPTGQARPEIEVLLGDGNDRATVRLGAITHGLKFSGDCGQGDDRFVVFLNGSLSGPVPVHFDLLGRDGADRLGVFAGNPDFDPDDLDSLLPTHGSPVTLNLQGGTGNDVATVEYGFMDVTAPQAWTLDTGEGNDLILAVLVDMNVDAPIGVTALGGAGDDRILVETVAFVHSVLTVSVDGGNDNDLITSDHVVLGNGTMVLNSLGGNGDDVIFQLYNGVVSGTLLGNTDGGNGADVIRVELGFEFQFEPDFGTLVAPLNIAAGARLIYNLNGGNGDDTLNVTYVGRIDGQLFVRTDGGHGNDRILANTFHVNALSRGQLSAQFLGDAGDDRLEAQLRFITVEQVPGSPPVRIGFSSTLAPLAARQVQADGGSGFDTCLHSALVSLLNVEDDQLI